MGSGSLLGGCQRWSWCKPQDGAGDDLSAQCRIISSLWLPGNSLHDSPGWPAIVDIMPILLHYAIQMSLSQDGQVVQEFSPHATLKPLADRAYLRYVRLWRSIRCSHSTTRRASWTQFSHGRRFRPAQAELVCAVVRCLRADRGAEGNTLARRGCQDRWAACRVAPSCSISLKGECCGKTKSSHRTP